MEQRLRDEDTGSSPVGLLRPESRSIKLTYRTNIQKGKWIGSEDPNGELREII